MRDGKDLDIASNKLQGELDKHKKLETVLEKLKNEIQIDIQEDMTGMVTQVNEKLDKLTAYNEIIDFLKNSYSILAKRVIILENENDDYRKLKKIVVGLSIAVSIITIIQGIVTLGSIIK